MTRWSVFLTMDSYCTVVLAISIMNCIGNKELRDRSLCETQLVENLFSYTQDYSPGRHYYGAAFLQKNELLFVEYGA